MLPTCKCCNYPLILRSQDDPSDSVWEDFHYEDGNDGYCFNCLDTNPESE